MLLECLVVWKNVLATAQLKKEVMENFLPRMNCLTPIIRGMKMQNRYGLLLCDGWHLAWLRSATLLPVFYFSARIILRLGLKTTLLITVLATVIRMTLYYFIKTPVATLPVELLHGFSWSLFWVVCVEYVNRLVDEHWLATGQSLLYAAYFGAGAIAGNYWTGFLLSNGMPLAQIFLLNAGIVMLVVIMIWIFVRQKTSIKKN